MSLYNISLLTYENNVVLMREVYKSTHTDYVIPMQSLAFSFSVNNIDDVFTWWDLQWNKHMQLGNNCEDLEK